jgi:hypothetical protein
MMTAAARVPDRASPAPAVARTVCAWVGKFFPRALWARIVDLRRFGAVHADHLEWLSGTATCRIRQRPPARSTAAGSPGPGVAG